MKDVVICHNEKNSHAPNINGRVDVRGGEQVARRTILRVRRHAITKHAQCRDFILTSQARLLPTVAVAAVVLAA